MQLFLNAPHEHILQWKRLHLPLASLPTSSTLPCLSISLYLAFSSPTLALPSPVHSPVPFFPSYLPLLFLSWSPFPSSSPFSSLSFLPTLRPPSPPPFYSFLSSSPFSYLVFPSTPLFFLFFPRPLRIVPHDVICKCPKTGTIIASDIQISFLMLLFFGRPSAMAICFLQIFFRVPE